MSSHLLVLASCTIVALWVKNSQKKRPPLPPGPPADPIIGHLRKIPPDHQEEVFYEWGREYGDVLYLEVLGKPIVVLNSVEAAVDLLEKRSSNYSDRPRFVIFEIMGWVRTLPFTGYGKRFQQHRRLMQGYLNMKTCVSYQPIQTREARILLQNLLADDTKRDNCIQRFATGVIMRVAYGHQVKPGDDPYVRISDEVSYVMSNGGSPGGTPVDHFPFLQYLPSWFPGAYYADFARKGKVWINALHNYPFEQVKKQLAEGKAKPSFSSQLLETISRDGGGDPEDALDIQYAAGVMYCAGAETTWSTMSFFFLAMVLHPEVQIRAQKEIDAVVGTNRLPEFSDRHALPYVEGVLQETLRWYGVVPLGVPHRSMEDDVYRGMFIPKRSLVIANTRAMTLDEKVYSNPRAFNPARYLPKPEGNKEPHPNGPFGFGRRICPGRYLADASLWIAFASMLATFDITKALDEDGNEITPELSYTGGLSSQPVPFKCCIKPRHEKSASLIMQADTWDNY